MIFVIHSIIHVVPIYPQIIISNRLLKSASNFECVFFPLYRFNFNQAWHIDYICIDNTVSKLCGDSLNGYWEKMLKLDRHRRFKIETSDRYDGI